MEELKLSLVRKEVQVSLADDSGASREYTLRELTGRGRDAYFKLIAGRMEFDQKGRASGVRSFDGLQSGLLALCLYDDQEKLVPKADIEEWPSSTLGVLFDKAQEISALTAKAQEEAGNG